MQTLCKKFFQGADVGFAVFDRRLRYRILNPCLASINGVPVNSHLGKTVYDIFGDLSGEVASALESVLTSGTPVHREIVGTLPGQSQLGRWTTSYFAVRNSGGALPHVGVVVVELARDIRLQNSGASGSVLRSWKEIAQYLGTCVKTAQRWERMYDIPVRRLQASKGAEVFALRSEIDRWHAETTANRSRTHARPVGRKN